jgi:hypothetical protein
MKQHPLLRQRKEAKDEDFAPHKKEGKKNHIEFMAPYNEMVYK